MDLSVLEELDSGIYIRDLSLPGGVEMITPSDLPVIRVTRTRAAATMEDDSGSGESLGVEEPSPQASSPDLADSTESPPEDSVES